MARLRDNGYNPISVQQILDAHDGKIVLPEKAVLLTFDDGWQFLYPRLAAAESLQLACALGSSGQLG